ncbi:MAG: InlB B-repeat-containing protein [Spirochaetales bacterium]|nr:InlB B-repeat-containing protein [Spirochaetales bacterium]
MKAVVLLMLLFVITSCKLDSSGRSGGSITGTEYPYSFSPGDQVYLRSVAGELVLLDVVDLDSDGIPDGLSVDGNASNLEFLALNPQAQELYQLDVDGNGTEDLFLHLSETAGITANTQRDGNGVDVRIVLDANMEAVGLDTTGDGNANISFSSITSLPTLYTLSFDGNGAITGTVPESIKGYENAQYTIPGNAGNLWTPTSEFVGWNAQNDGSGTTLLQNTTVTLTQNRQLFAEWNYLAPIPPNASDVTISRQSDEKILVSWTDPPGDLTQVDVSANFQGAQTTNISPGIEQADLGEAPYLEAYTVSMIFRNSTEYYSSLSIPVSLTDNRPPSLVPTMTGADLDVANRRSVGTTAQALYESWRAFDGQTQNAQGATYISAFDPVPYTDFSEWLSYAFPSPQLLQGYGMFLETSAGMSDDIPKSSPVTWVFQGSNDTETANPGDKVWVNLHSENSYTAWNYPEPGVFLLDTSTAYQYYRILVTETHAQFGAGVKAFGLAEWELY